jgi:phosphatidylglycerophosphate synthase
LDTNVETNLSGSRRPLQTRSKKWAQGLAAWMARTGFSPNGVSLLGLGVAALGAGAMLKGWWWAAAVCVQLRLLCNMLDGLIAVEHGKGDKLGGFFNEVPDRAEDAMLLLAAGYAAGGPWGVTLGWSAALLAVLTAYLRQTGGAMGLAQDFCGPLAKPQRMFVLTVTLLAAGGVEVANHAACEGPLVYAQRVLVAGLSVIAAGTAITVARRTVRLMEALKNR